MTYRWHIAIKFSHLHVAFLNRSILLLVSIYFRLIKERTSVLNKMENDLLPLKVRVNRLHDDVSKAVKPPLSTESDLTDSFVKSGSESSMEDNSNIFAKEIHNMLGKLSKMEFTIRHLIEEHVNSQGRSSV